MQTSLPARSTCQNVQPLQAGKALREGADLVDRADDRAESQRAVGANRGLVAAAFVDEDFAGFHVAAFEQREKRHPRFGALLRRGSDEMPERGSTAVDARAGRLGIDRDRARDR